MLDIAEHRQKLILKNLAQLDDRTNEMRVCHKSMAHPLLCYLLYNPRSIVSYSKKGII